MKKISYIRNIEEWKKEFSFYYQIKVRFSETDMFGHLNNTVPFIYFEAARTEYFSHLGFMRKWTDQESECIPVVADLQCDFLHQVYFGDELMIYVKTENIGNSSVDLHYMGKKYDGTICFTGRGAMVQISKKTGKSIAWSDEMKNLLKPQAVI